MALCCAFVHAQMKGMGDLAWPDLAAAMQPYEDCCVRGSVGGNPSEYSPLKDCTCFQGATDVFQSMLSGGLLMCGRVILGHLHEQGSHFRPSPGGTINIHHILRHPDNLRFLASGYSASFQVGTHFSTIILWGCSGRCPGGYGDVSNLRLVYTTSGHACAFLNLNWF